YDTPGNLNSVPMLRGVLDHHHGIRIGGDRSPGHDRYGLPTADVRRKFVERLTGPNFTNHVQHNWELQQICGSHGIAIASGARKRRKVAVSHHRFGENAAGGGEKIYAFRATSHYERGLLLDRTARIFKAEDHGRDRRGTHAQMIRHSKEGSTQ